MGAREEYKRWTDLNEQVESGNKRIVLRVKESLKISEQRVTVSLA